MVLSGGPTIDNDFQNAFGSVTPDSPGGICGGFFYRDTSMQVTAESLTLDEPFTTVGACASAVGPAPTCTSGLVLPVFTLDSVEAPVIGCRLGVRLASGTDPAGNYEGAAVLEYSAVCTGVGPTDTVCADPQVVARHPSPSAPVPVTWDAMEVTVPLRYCGATDYAIDDEGTPLPEGTSPSESSADFGCTP